MELFEFITLPSKEKARTVWNQGIYLCTRSYDNGFINLYGVSSFYVEVYYHTGISDVEDIVCFESVHGLDPYLDNILLEL